MLEFFHFTKSIPFMRYGKITTATSLATFLFSVFALAFYGLNLGVDFTGGTVMEVRYAQAAPLDTIREAIKATGYHEVAVQNFGSTQDVLIRLPLKEGVSSAQVSEQIMGVLKTSTPDVALSKVDFVGGQVGQELYENGGLALILVAAGIIIYLAFRFEWRFAVSAAIANLHDIVIILGLFAFFQWQFDLTVLAGVLAVLGYSVNESVVVFDRIRENIRTMRDETIPDIIDSAITTTMSRTIITHLATQTMVTSMLWFGGEALHNFALALTIGIMFGIYSSVLVAAPLLLLFGLKREHMLPKESEKIEGMNADGSVV
ncbi:protein translocase subunit SecF [Thiothrix fructosivorans]|uniref:Protein-export membrane protein SecF n=1 Tax=Thiothrix fructosivorans TaxID=111770 RepID=A0A8B0SJT4_9GAMM|nr:protein translocase subunit SecF [Thiothrix fructosivorans]MBO0611606.1 protein translocase subunit SecF [Thiothrix fructosivorans]QTX10730.1 protein translocase subunit SecF [Thiothrix fructosivorans]